MVTGHEKRIGNSLRSISLILVLVFVPLAAAGHDSPAGVEILRISAQRDEVMLLKPYLESDLANIRVKAALAVGRIAGPAEAGENPFQATALLAPLLSDSDPSVVLAAGFALGLIGSETSAVILASRLVSGQKTAPEVKAALIEALGRTGSLQHPLPYRRCLNHNEPVVVQAALLAVWRGSVLPHLEKIIELSYSKNTEIRWRAAYALMRSLGAPPAGRTPAATRAPLTRTERIQVLTRLQQLSRDGDLRVRLQAMRSLRSGEGNHALAAAMKEALHDGLSSEDPRLRVESLRSLSGLLAGSGELDLVLPALRDSHPHVRIEAIRALGGISEAPVTVARLSPLLAGDNAWERAVAIETTVGALVADGLYLQALHMITKAAGDSDWTVRYAAGNALTALWQATRESGDEASEPVDLAALRSLVDRYRNDEPRVAKAVIYPWVVYQDNGNFSNWLAALGPLLHHDDEVLRLLAIDGIREWLVASGACPPEGSCSLASADLDHLLIITNVFTDDPSPDVRETLAPLLTLLAESSSREEVAKQLTKLAAYESARLITDYQAVIHKALLAREAIWETESGKLRAELFGAEAPLTVYNFTELVDAGYYGNSAWHRVVPDFVVQDGCPRGDGWGGPGYAIRCEYNSHSYQPGMLGMALAGKDTGGSQYFFTLSDQPHLDGRYTIFGRLIDGWDVLTRISQGEPIQSIRIVYGK
jgi:peptidyl-prolyl cis-trans isomerase B (cyclophilin B)